MGASAPRPRGSPLGRPLRGLGPLAAWRRRRPSGPDASNPAVPIPSESLTAIVRWGCSFVTTIPYLILRLARPALRIAHRAHPPTTCLGQAQGRSLLQAPNPLGVPLRSGAVPPTSGAVPPISGAVPPTSGAVPPISGAVPPTSGAVPPISSAVPPTPARLPPISGALPPTSGAVPPISGAVPPTSARLPRISGAVPQTSGAVPPTSGAVPPTSGAVPLTSHAVPPTSHPLPPISGALPPTSRPLPASSRVLHDFAAGLPPIAARLPESDGGLPKIDGGLPLAAAGLFRRPGGEHRSARLSPGSPVVPHSLPRPICAAKRCLLVAANSTYTVPVAPSPEHEEERLQPRALGSTSPRLPRPLDLGGGPPGNLGHLVEHRMIRSASPGPALGGARQIPEGTVHLARGWMR
jgi:hypothetical protein